MSPLTGAFVKLALEGGVVVAGTTLVFAIANLVERADTKRAGRVTSFDVHADQALYVVRNTERPSLRVVR